MIKTFITIKMKSAFFCKIKKRFKRKCLLNTIKYKILLRIFKNQMKKLIKFYKNKSYFLKNTPKKLQKFKMI